MFHKISTGTVQKQPQTVSWGMKRCSSYRDSITTQWLSFTRRHYARNTKGSEFQHGEPRLEASDQAPPADREALTEDGSKEAKTTGPTERPDVQEELVSKLKKHLKSLPQSPLLNPSFHEAREKHHRPKAPPSKNPTPFQQQLAKNPYALALATPIRRCSASKEALPRFFLEDYTLLTHPNTGQPWWVPRNLIKKHTSVKEAESTSQETTTSKPDTHKPSSTEQAGGIHDYILSRKLLLQAFETEGSGYTKAISNFAYIHQSLPGPRALIENAYFRTDMDIFVLSLMRRRIVELLAYLVGLKRGYVVGCADWEDAKRKPQIGVILWNVPENLKEGKPPEFATLEIGERKRKVPVHDLRRLLGDEQLKRLKGLCGNGIWEREVLVLKHRRVTIDIQLKLWKLQGYLAQYGSELDVGGCTSGCKVVLV